MHVRKMMRFPVHHREPSTFGIQIPKKAVTDWPGDRYRNRGEEDEEKKRVRSLWHHFYLHNWTVPRNMEHAPEGHINRRKKLVAFNTIRVDMPDGHTHIIYKGIPVVTHAPDGEIIVRTNGFRYRTVMYRWRHFATLDYMGMLPATTVNRFKKDGGGHIYAWMSWSSLRVIEGNYWGRDAQVTRMINIPAKTYGVYLGDYFPAYAAYREYVRRRGGLQAFIPKKKKRIKKTKRTLIMA